VIITLSVNGLNILIKRDVSEKGMSLAPAEHGGAHLQSQHSRDGGRKITELIARAI
jgi:hypothetical protein